MNEDEDEVNAAKINEIYRSIFTALKNTLGRNNNGFAKVDFLKSLFKGQKTRDSV